MLIPSNLLGKSSIKGPIQDSAASSLVFFIKVLQVSTHITQRALIFNFY